MRAAPKALRPFFLSDDPDEVLAAAAAIPNLSSGRVTKPDLANTRTKIPEREGLLCARIFGPITDHRCICGKLATEADAGETCDKCGVLCGLAELRQQRFGHLELAVPVLHPVLAPLVSGAIGCTVKQLQRLCRHQAWLDPDGAVIVVQDGHFDDEDGTDGPARGAEFIATQLDDRSEWMLRSIPVTPAGWREGRRDPQDAAYQRLINRQNRLARLTELAAPPIILANEERMLHDAFERLYKTVREQLIARQQPRATKPSPRGRLLLDAVLQDPAADAPRQVYADYLGERGDPRGEFIVLQLIESAGLRPRMSKRESELLRQHVDDWLGVLAPVVDRVVFRRGFLVSCRALDEAAAKTASEPAWATVERLDSDQLELITSPSMRALQELRTNFQTLVALCKRGEAMPHIRRSMVRMSSCPPRGWEQVASSELLPGLSELTMLLGSRSGGADWSWLLDSPLCQQLERLVLCASLEGTAGLSIDGAIEQLDRHPRLRQLTFSYGNKALLLVLERDPSDRGRARLQLHTAAKFLERVPWDEEGELTRGLFGAIDACEAAGRVSCFEVVCKGAWFGEHLAALAARIEQRFGAGELHLPAIE